MTEPRKLTPFQQALLDSVLDDYRDELEFARQRHIFSAEFECWFKNFCRNNTARRVRIRGIIRKVLIAAVIIALLVGTVLAIPAVREALINFFTHDYVEGIAISFDPQQAETAPNSIETVYQIDALPDGYELRFAEKTFTCHAQWWTNQNSEWITYMQYIIPNKLLSDSALTIDAYNNSKYSRQMRGYEVKIIEINQNRKLIWTNNAYFFTLEIPMSVTDEEMELIFASWGPKE